MSRQQLQLLIKTFSMLSMLALVVLVGCGRPGEVAPDEYQRIVERIREIVGNQLDLNAGQVDVDVPLSKQKKVADELDVVEIVMTVEEAFNIEIKARRPAMIYLLKSLQTLCQERSLASDIRKALLDL